MNIPDNKQKGIVMVRSLKIILLLLLSFFSNQAIASEEFNKVVGNTTLSVVGEDWEITEDKVVAKGRYSFISPSIPTISSVEVWQYKLPGYIGKRDQHCLTFPAFIAKAAEREYVLVWFGFATQGPEVWQLWRNEDRYVFTTTETVKMRPSFRSVYEADKVSWKTVAPRSFRETCLYGVAK